MNPIYNEYLQFLKDHNVDLEKYNLKEGYFWLNRMVIKAYNKNGEAVKIARVNVSHDLSVEVSDYGRIPSIEDLETWQETIERNKDKLIELENESLDLIRDRLGKYSDREPIILTSGGKDSQVTSHLVKQIIPDCHSIFNNTSLDCADTYLTIKKEKNIEILSPKEGFYQWRKRLKFVPTRFSRACCNEFKEGETVKQVDKNRKILFFMGMRNQESASRSGYIDDWRNGKWEDREWDAILPIRKWTEEEIWLYMIWKNIDVNSKYKKGYARVGCAISCPFYSKSTWVLDKYWYESGYERWQKIIREDFIENNKWLVMNCTLEEYKSCWAGGVYREEPTEEVIEEFAKYSNLDLEIARGYFNHKCDICEKKVKQKDAVGMNMKYFGRNTQKFYCKKHMREYLGDMMREKISNKRWDEIVEDFKRQECDLF